MSTESTNASNQGIARHIPLLAVLMLGMFLAILNQTLLNVAIPPIINEMNITASTAQWLLTGYMLINGILIPLSAYLIERFGVRLLFLAAMFFFTAGSLICGVAPSFAVLLIGRLVQAIGGGILMPLVMTIILFIFPPQMRGKGMGIFGLGMMFAPAIGPTLSGWILEHHSWRLLFNGMVPLGIFVTLVAFFVLKDLGQRKKTRLDLLGSVISTLGFGTLLYGLSEAGTRGWADSVVVSCIVLGVLLVALFIILQIQSPEPLLDFRVFKYDMFSLSSVVSAIVTVAMYAGMFLLPIYLQNLRGFTPFESGLLILPGAVIMGIMSPISGSLFDKWGPRPLAVAGLLVTAVTTYEFTQLTLETSYSHILMLNMIRSFGMSLLMMPIMTAGLNQLPREKNSHGTAMSNTLRQIAGSIGISIFTTIFSTRTTFHLGKLSEQVNIMDPAFAQTFASHAAATGLPAAEAEKTLTAYLYGQAQMQAAVQGIDDAFIWATGVTLVGLVLSFFLRDVRKDKPTKTTQADPPQPDGPAADVKKEAVVAG
ncbi:drug resistance transporter, EmrB/QacA subfamily [Lihuaxuella thermophila]|uniref:Drug resistance transporter, EmrB/QacA subfamily n=1 Tax=Lihuaxuella thermophila TaxID=1173111 RepID=A0A1H8J2D4_9BACL|nr:DHA2 family efflux MFS transporter permease subunit [Lihuaxuella thermophila]SEN74892.1 drug resistance transporter, EmrB/QacA subfamily [Lihuaxuella thermophila]